MLDELRSSTSLHQQSINYSLLLESFSSALALTPAQTANTTSVTSSADSLREFTAGLSAGPRLLSPSTPPVSPYILKRQHDMDDLSKLFAIALCYVFAALAVAGLIGNLLVIIVILRNTHLQTTTNILIMCAYLLSDFLKYQSYVLDYHRLEVFQFNVYRIILV